MKILMILDFKRNANFLQINDTFENLMKIMDILVFVERCWEGVTQKYVLSIKNKQ